MKGMAAMIAALVVVTACKKTEPDTQVVEMAPAPGTVPWKIQNARSAAPPSISAGATVRDVLNPDTAWGPVLVQGSDSTWTCFADNPATTQNDPYCTDGEGMKFVQAWRTQQPPRLTAMAVAYILQGSASYSDTDPFKAAPDSGQQPMMDPPHIAEAMPNARSYAGLPTRRRADGPWVKYAGTPYAYIVIPSSGPPAP